MGQLYFDMLEEAVCDDSFNCGNHSIERKISESYWLTILQHAYAYKISTDGIILGYYMILFRKIALAHCPDNISEYYSGMMDYCISVHLDYLAVDKRYQHKKIGTNTMKIIINSVLRLAKRFPVRLITIDALKEYYSWYQAIGYSAFNENDMDDGNTTIKMYMDCLSCENKERINKYMEA